MKPIITTNYLDYCQKANRKRFWLKKFQSILMGFLLSMHGLTPSNLPARNQENFIQNCTLAGCTPVTWHRPYVIFYTARGFPQVFIPQIQSAMQTWNAVPGTKPILVYGGNLTDLNNCSPMNITACENVIFWTPEKCPQNPAIQANTQTLWTGDSAIYNTTIMVYAGGFAFSNTSLPFINTVDIESLFLHEFGHVLGLNHSDVPYAVMYPALANGQLRRNLTQVEIKNIQEVYPGLASPGKLNLASAGN